MNNLDKKHLCLIIDGEPAFLRTKVEETYKSWGFARKNVHESNVWAGQTSGLSLFGERTITHLNLEDKKDMKNFVSIITSKDYKNVFSNEFWIGNGVIITCSTSQGAKKIQDLVEKFGGKVFKKESVDNRKNELLDTLNLNNDAKKLVDYFVGEDYSLLLSFNNEMSKLSKEEQYNISSDKILTYFPPTPGSIPPWSFITPLMEGQTTEAENQFSRIIKNTHILVPMLFLQRNISLLLRIAISRLDIPNSPKQLALSIGEKPYGAFWGAYNLAKRTSVRNVVLANKEVIKLENDIKGNSSVVPEIEFKATIAKLGLLLNH